jgi:hypothetical protein
MVLTPRKKFQDAAQTLRVHRELVVSDSFRSALESALVEYALTLLPTDDPQKAAASFHRIEGAREFINHLLNIGETAAPPVTRPSANLDHKL